ncbi:type 2 periplasmic-binding domain-containing protein [Streptomyces halobius]|uniref:Uncharacterized protein n=1 Tax=Streptomyces halobius TaxID=2879846 RepID=A0ABY4MFA6_9ACTN|nr:hypothetical protein [Streptomyces halobius]UQA96168.1 hypothetical protein K9S39_33675 [Streptomyces halobius]
MVAQLRPYEGLTVNTLESAWANGGDREATSFTKGEQVGTLQQGVADIKDRLDSITPHEATTMDETESRRWCAEGRAVFMRNWPVEYASVAEKLKPGVPRPTVRHRPTPGRCTPRCAAQPRPRSAHYQTFSKVAQIRVPEYLNSRGGTAIADPWRKEANEALSGRG